MMDFNATYNKSSNVVSRKIEGETILVPILSNEKDVDSIYMLNDVAGFIWEQLDGKKNMEKIIEEVVKEYHVSVKQAGKDASSLLKQLKKTGCLI